MSGFGWSGENSGRSAPKELKLAGSCLIWVDCDAQALRDFCHLGNFVEHQVSEAANVLGQEISKDWYLNAHRTT